MVSTTRRSFMRRARIRSLPRAEQMRRWRQRQASLRTGRVKRDAGFAERPRSYSLPAISRRSVNVGENNITGSDVIANVPTFKSYDLQLGPAWHPSTRFGRMAMLFEEWRVNSMVVEFVPNSHSLVSGSYVACVDSDPTDTMPYTDTEADQVIMAHQPSGSARVSEPLRLRLRIPASRPNLFTSLSEELRTCSVGKVMLRVFSDHADYGGFRIILHYDIDFFIPQLEANTEVFRASDADFTQIRLPVPGTRGVDVCVAGQSPSMEGTGSAVFQVKPDTLGTCRLNGGSGDIEDAAGNKIPDGTQFYVRSGDTTYDAASEPVATMDINDSETSLLKVFSLTPFSDRTYDLRGALTNAVNSVIGVSDVRFAMPV